MAAVRSGQVSLTPPGVRRMSYVVTVVICLGLLYVVNNLFEWATAPFLTEDFELIVPVLNVALIAGIVVNVVWMVYDAAWIRSAGRITLNLIVIGTTAITLRVFPFDFAAYSFDWDAVVTFGLVAVIIALVAASIVEAVRLGGILVNR